MLNSAKIRYAGIFAIIAKITVHSENFIIAKFRYHSENSASCFCVQTTPFWFFSFLLL